MKTTIKVSSKYQIVIPKWVREQMHLKPGTELTVVAFDGTMHLVPLRPLSEMEGAFEGMDTTIEREPDRF